MPRPNPLIVALDVSSSLKALNLVERLKVTGVAFKIGFELFCTGGRKLVEKIVSHDVRVFLDLKFHDIPNTVGQACGVATKMGVWMMNVHASGGSAMMKAAHEAVVETSAKEKIESPLLIAVTVLTSLSDLSEQRVEGDVENQVVHLAGLAQKAGLQGVVASAREASLLKKKYGSDFCLVTPGIRLPNSPLGDQKRVATPREALEAGSHYIVVGRPILSAPKPLEVIHQILSSLK